MNKLSNLNSKLLSTGKKYTAPKTIVSNETIDLSMILFIYACFFILLFVILVLNTDYNNLNKYKRFSHDPEEATNIFGRIKSWFLCDKNCTTNTVLTSKNNTNINHKVNDIKGLNTQQQCWADK